MTALIQGKEIAHAVRTDVHIKVEELFLQTGRRPGLATVLVGGDPASEVYVASKRKSCVAAGMIDLHRHLDGGVDQGEVEALVDKLAADDSVSGILIQLPLPSHLDAEALIARIPSGKDVDGLTTASAGLLAQGKAGLRPCTPLGVIELLDRSGIPIEGSRAVVVGRSALVGRPLAQLLVQRNATVTIAHSKTQNLAEVTGAADIVVAAAGVPKLLTAEHIREGATVIDVGIHRTETGLCGDVDFESVSGKAGFLTPVPGGVGPMTIAMLLSNTLKAAEAQFAAPVV